MSINEWSTNCSRWVQTQICRSLWSQAFCQRTSRRTRHVAWMENYWKNKKTKIKKKNTYLKYLRFFCLYIYMFLPILEKLFSRRSSSPMLFQKLESHPSGGQYVHLQTRVHKDLRDRMENDTSSHHIQYDFDYLFSSTYPLIPRRQDQKQFDRDKRQITFYISPTNLLVLEQNFEMRSACQKQKTYSLVSAVGCSLNLLHFMSHRFNTKAFILSKSLNTFQTRNRKINVPLDYDNFLGS